MKRFFRFFGVITALVMLFTGASSAAASENQIVSAFYGVNRESGLIGQIAPGTDEATFLSRVLIAGEASLADGIKTGSTLAVASDGVVTDSLTLVVQSDCSGDGVFSVTDMLMVKSLLLNQQAFSSAQEQAADVSGDGAVTITDFLQMKSKVLGQTDFTAHQLSGAAQHRSVLLAPGETCAFATADTPAESIVIEGDAVTWDAGMITAVKLGTARLTYDMESLIVSVCSEPLKISFASDTLALNPGAAAQLQPVLNYPVNTAITYSVSDTTIAKVDESGMVTAVAEGTAVVTATLPSGASATQTLNVLPLIQTVAFEKDSIKVKNGSTKALAVAISPADSTEELIWTSSDTSIATVDANGVVTGLKNGTVTITCTSRYGKAAASCSVKVCNLIQIALTFDDGPSSAYTGKVLDMLEKYGIKASFFMVGERIAGREAIVARMAEEGHELGYHTWAHSYFSKMTAAQIEADFNLFQQTLKAACGREATLYRAPGGGITNTALATIPLPHIMWSVDTRDWETKNTEKVKNAILGGLRDGAIILVHDIHKTTYTGTLAALEIIFTNDMDVEFLTVTELLSRHGEDPEAGKTYYKSPSA